MIFQKFVCWRSEQVQRIMNVEATQPPDHIFLATHHPLAMYQQALIEASSPVAYNEQKFLKDFLTPESFAFVPVIGDSGTGKSHLIRWLAANIESTEKRKVLLIPKIGTNLKDIIDKILDIEGIEGQKFDEYRQRLNQATSTLTMPQAREQLLNNLAAAVGRNGRHDRSQLDEEQNYLVDELDSLLYDPYFRREYWLKDGSIIHRLVIHALIGQNTIEDIEEKTEFSTSDLPSSILELQKAGQQAQRFYSFLIDHENIQKATTEWLNQHLDEAITRVLSLGREDLQRLMREVREALAEKGIELVILIEDFAKLQGIDREVLAAVLEQPQQSGRKPLCTIRTALACTEGYFNSYVLETVRQRITFQVNLNIGAVSNQSLVTDADIQQFVVRYLNAVRLEDEEILSWANARNEPGVKKAEPPNFCDMCEHREPCHQGFGQVNGMGLYPFTSTALKQMLWRVNPGNFKPRVLIKDVLKYTLENSVDDIQQGKFPSAALREHFGKRRLDVIVQDEIRAKDLVNGDRREILIDFWSDSDQLCDLPQQVHTAFNIPVLGIIIEQKPVSGPKELPEPYKIEPEISPKKSDEISEKVVKQLIILNNWNNQEILSDEISKELREFIYPAIIERIEWDTEILLRGSFAGSNQLFKQRNLIFESRKVTRGTYSGIVLSLPLNPEDEKDFRETVIAFQGILQYKHYKNWKFPKGDRYFRAYAKQLERWSQYIVEEIRCRPRECREAWNPIPATAELLAIAARMSGHSTNSVEDLINSLFLELEDQDELSRSKTWKELFQVFKKNRKKLFEIFESRIACTRGSRSQFQIIDSAQIIETLRQLRKSWQPQGQIPNDLRDEYQVIQKVREKVDELLLKAIEEERDRQLKVYQLLISEFGEDVKKKEVIDGVKLAIDQAREAGVFGQKSAEKLTIVIDEFSRTRFGGYVENMKRVQTETNPHKLLQYLSEEYQKAMTDADGFLKETNNFLDTSLNRVQNEISQLKSGEGGAVEDSHQAIKNGLSKLSSLLNEIKG